MFFFMPAFYAIPPATSTPYFYIISRLPWQERMYNKNHANIKIIIL